MVRIAWMFLVTLSSALVVLAGGSLVHAQAPPAFQLNKSGFTWILGVAAPQTAPALYYEVRCGTAAGGRTLKGATSSGTVSILPLNAVITAPGTYWCAVVAVNVYGESSESNEINFRAGWPPPPAATLGVVVTSP